MVRWMVLLSLFWSCALFGGEFKASVNRNEVGLGESFTLSLSLSGASSKERPSFSDLRKSFIIHGQQQSSHTSIVNGSVSSSINWNVTLLPQKEGNFTIPSISIQTTEGALLSTAPINIQVTKQTASNAASSSNLGINITSQINQKNPYKNEPFIYSVRLISKREVANIEIQKLILDDAIVDVIGQPMVEERIVNGINMKILDIHYLITPLKSGSLTIPSVVIQGGIPGKRKSSMGSFFDDDFFTMMSPFTRLEPFAVATEEKVLKIREPVAGVNPWIPAQSLTIEESLDGAEKLQVGEPFTRTFTIKAVGAKATQLPNLGDLNIYNSSFKVYSDKPQTEEQVRKNQVYSVRKEQYTVIPQEAGAVTLPEISLAWWDVTHNKIAYAKIPKKELRIEQPSYLVQEGDQQDTLLQPTSTIVVQKIHWSVYLLIAGLIAFLLFVIFWVISLKRKLAHLTDASSEKPKKKKNQPLPLELKELQSITTVQELYRFLQTYAHQKWKTSKNETLSGISDVMRKYCAETALDEIASLEKLVHDGLYLNKKIDLQEIVTRYSVVLSKTKAIKKSLLKEKLPDLNPS